MTHALQAVICQTYEDKGHDETGGGSGSGSRSRYRCHVAGTLFGTCLPDITPPLRYHHSQNVRQITDEPSSAGPGTDVTAWGGSQLLAQATDTGVLIKGWYRISKSQLRIT